MRQFDTKLYDYAIPQSDYIDARVLAANTPETFTVPADACFVVFSATGDFYARYTGTAAVPAADVSDGTGSELNPLYRRVTPGDQISVVMPVTGVVTASYFS